VLLEVAEQLHVRPPRVGVDLVFLDGEDFGRPSSPSEYCRGSRGYAKRLPPPGDPARPVAGLPLRPGGDRDLEIWDEANSRSGRQLVDWCTRAAAATGAKHFKAACATR
jgi:hypothetical protein